MEITWLGHSCFRFKGKEATLVTDPFDPSHPGLPGWPQPAAQVVTISHNHPGHNNAGGVAGGPRVLSGPGEYEVAGVYIQGFASFHDAEGGQRLGRNTIFLIELDGVRLCHLGDLGHPLSPQQVEGLQPVDVLLVPIGGGTSLGAAAAAQMVRQLEPRLVIPMHYKAEAAAPLDSFAQEMGLKPQPPVPRLSVTQANLPAESRMVVLSPSR